MRVLVTGGAGYVGSHVVRSLLAAGHEPIVFDNLSAGHIAAIGEAEAVVGDVADSARLRRTLSERVFDGCIHLAALSLVAESVQRPSHYFRNNVLGGLNLLDALVIHEVPWVVFSSTAAVYGEPSTPRISESNPIRPTSPYGDSKAMMEKVLERYEVAHGLRHIALRYFNAAGAHPSGAIGEDHSPETHLIPIVMAAALGLRDGVSVFGDDYPTHDGTAVRDYVHVCDLADAHLKAMHRLQSGGPSGVYNLGGERGYSVLEIIDMVSKVTGRSVHTNRIGRRPGDPATLVASSELARIELGWAPRNDLRAIIESAWRWHETHPHGYRKC